MTTITKSFTNSSQVSAIWYREDQKELEVLFTSGGRYIYLEVPKEIWDRAIQAESIGKFLNTEVKGKFLYKKI